MHKLRSFFTVLILCLLAFSAQAMAQIDRATLNGTVTDGSGAVVQNVKIELDSPATGLHRETATDTKGSYQLPALPIGAYKITISKDGFKPAVFEAVELLEVNVPPDKVTSPVMVNVLLTALLPPATA